MVSFMIIATQFFTDVNEKIHPYCTILITNLNCHDKKVKKKNFLFVTYTNVAAICCKDRELKCYKFIKSSSEYRFTADAFSKFSS